MICSYTNWKVYINYNLNDYINKSSAVAEMGDRLATIDMDGKVGGCCAPFRGEELGFRLTHCGLDRGLPPTPSGILIHPAV